MSSRRRKAREMPRVLVAGAQAAGLPSVPARRRPAGRAQGVTRCGCGRASARWRCGRRGGRLRSADLEEMIADT